jgi:hypothetical protein
MYTHSELHNLNLKLGGKQYNKIDPLHLLLAPQLRGGWQQPNRQTGCANEQPTCSLMSTTGGPFTLFYVCEENK